MDQIYNFVIKNQVIGVTSQDGKDYHVSINSIYAGVISPEVSDYGVKWVSKDLISEALAAEIGQKIEDEDL